MVRDDEQVLDPREVDVLCGRGGMSNHHPGNEWYRRLIRSNRPLYRACPKHTKLLVSKAIVQAVEQQGGRFLERNRGDGFWYPVPYKRSVDKTSQGLRERDRDDDPKQPEVSIVPDSFSGRLKGGPNLADLASVAIAHATRTDGLPPTNLHKRPAPVKQEQMNNNKRLRAAVPFQREEDDFMGDDTPLPPTMEPRQSSMFRLLRQTQLFPGQSTKVGWYMGGAPPPAAPPPPVPPPASNNAYNYNNYNNNNNNNNTAPINSYPTKLRNLQTTAPDKRRIEQVPNPYGGPLPPVAPTSGLFSYASGLFSGHAGAPPAPAAAPVYHPGQQQQQQQGALSSPDSGGGGNNGGGGAPPPLSRLTSQVSDWLTSFWPLPQKGTNGNISPTPPEQQQQGQAAYPSEPMDNLLDPNPNGVLPFNPQPRKLPPSIRNQITIPAPIDLNADTPIIRTVPPPQHNSQLDDSSSRRYSNSSSTSNKRKSGTLLPNLPYYTADEPVSDLLFAGRQQHQSLPAASSFDSVLGGADVLPPADLESSVSTMMLKLAASPSKLFTGLTSFFDRPTATAAAAVADITDALGVGDVDNDNEEFVGPTDAVPRRASKSKSNLLDDYEESPMEARMRAVR